MTRSFSIVVITIFIIFFAQVLAAPVADAEADAEACFFGNYGSYGDGPQRPPPIIFIGPGQGPIFNPNPPGTIFGRNPPSVISNRNAVKPGTIPTNNRIPPVNIVQGGQNPDIVSYPLYYDDYGIY